MREGEEEEEETENVAQKRACHVVAKIRHTCSILYAGSLLLGKNNMRFRFCGDLDCPDWVLAEMNIMSKITSVRMKLIVVQVLNEMLGGAIDYAKVEKLVSNARWEPSDIKASIAAISFILTNATKFGVDGDTLAIELQQLGLPKEHTISMCKSYKSKISKLRERLREKSLHGPMLSKVDWRVDYVMSSSALEAVDSPAIQLKLTVSGNTLSSSSQSSQPTEHSFCVEDTKFGVLLSELKQAVMIMEAASSSTSAT